MADATFVFRVSGGRGEVSALSLDAAIAERHSQECLISDFPVETGADISDHVRPKPRVLDVEGFVTATPPGGAPNFGRPVEVAQQLEKLRLDATPCRILTSLRSYDNMVLQSLQIPRDSRTTEALRFSATFREVLLVETQTVAIPKPRGNGLQSKDKRGKQGAAAASPQRERSAAAWLEDVVTGK